MLTFKNISIIIQIIKNLQTRDGRVVLLISRESLVAGKRSDAKMNHTHRYSYSPNNCERWLRYC